MQNTFSNAVSEAISKHIALSATRRRDATWLALLIMRHGTIGVMTEVSQNSMLSENQ